MNKAREWAAQDRAMARALQEVDRLVMAKRLQEVDGMSQQGYWAWKRAQERAPRADARRGMAALERAVTRAQNERAPDEAGPSAPSPTPALQTLAVPVRGGTFRITCPQPLARADLDRLRPLLDRLLVVEAAP